MGVFVLGMHRSGTSAVTRAINAFGVPLGNEADVMPPAPDNPEGFAESLALVDCNERLLRLLGSRWDAPPALLPGWEHRSPVAIERDRAERTFRVVYAGEHWVWKDPRTCITWAFWDSVLGGPERDHKIVLVVREPRAVARSLGRRNRLTKPYALALWERYARSALAAATGRTVLVADYDRLMSDAAARRSWIDAMAAVLAEEVADGPFVESAAAMLHPVLDHHAAESVAFDDDKEVSPEQRALYHAMVALDLVATHFTPPPLRPETPKTARRFAEHRYCHPTAACRHRKLVVDIPAAGQQGPRQLNGR